MFLLISSHVTHGYVGNRASVLPLQLLGRRVDEVHTATFSSALVHSGSHQSPAIIRSILEGLPLASSNVLPCEEHPHPGPVANIEDLTKAKSINSLPYTVLLTGYCSAENLKEILIFYKKYPSMMWVCDPILGDNGKLYTPPSLLDLYRKEILYHVFMITPNEYELEWLSDIKLPTSDKEPSVLSACEFLKSTYKMKNIVVTSVDHGGDILTLYGVCEDDTCFSIDFVKQQPGWLGGTGDLMAAILAHWMEKENDLRSACIKALTVVQKVFRATGELYPYSAQTIEPTVLLHKLPYDYKFQVRELGRVSSNVNQDILDVRKNGG